MWCSVARLRDGDLLVPPKSRSGEGGDMRWPWGSRASVEHPEFGRLVLDGQGNWIGSVSFLTEAAVQLRIDGASGGLPGWAEASFAVLRDRFAALESRILSSLFEEYTRHDLPFGCPAPASAAALGALLVMDEIHLAGPSSVQLGYGFMDGIGWDDAMLTVHIEDWDVAWSRIDD